MIIENLAAIFNRHHFTPMIIIASRLHSVSPALNLLKMQLLFLNVVYLYHSNFSHLNLWFTLHFSDQVLSRALALVYPVNAFDYGKLEVFLVKTLEPTAHEIFP